MKQDHSFKEVEDEDNEKKIMEKKRSTGRQEEAAQVDMDEELDEKEEKDKDLARVDPLYFVFVDEFSLGLITAQHAAAIYTITQTHNFYSTIVLLSDFEKTWRYLKKSLFGWK